MILTKSYLRRVLDARENRKNETVSCVGIFYFGKLGFISGVRTDTHIRTHSVIMVCAVGPVFVLNSVCVCFSGRGVLQ